MSGGIPPDPPPPLQPPSQPPAQAQPSARAMPFHNGVNEDSQQHDLGHGQGGAKEAPKPLQDQGPGQSQLNEKKGLYSERLRSNIRYDQKLKRNVLEISMTKENSREAISINTELVFRILNSIKMDTSNTPSREYHGHYVRYGKTPTIVVLCKQHVNLEKFCRNENIQISATLRVSNIRPANRREVVVTVVGLDWCTPDTLVHEYLSKFGTKIKDDVIYCKYDNGPLRGGLNGERQYIYDFSDSPRKPGTFHILDSARVKIFFKGNTSTCARCHKTRSSCPGGGYANVCEENEGIRISLANHMTKLWNEIGFTPSDFTLPEEDEELQEDLHEDPNQIHGDKPIVSKKPPPKKAVISEEIAAKHNGLQINNLPADLNDEEVKIFLQEKVSGSLSDEDYKKKTGTNITIYIEKGLTQKDVEEATKLLDRHSNGEKKIKVQGRDARFLYCKPIRELTPEKPETPVSADKPTFPSTDLRERLKGKETKKDFINSPNQPKIASIFKNKTSISTPVNTLPSNPLHARPSTLDKMKAEGVVTSNPLAQAKRSLDPTSPTGLSPPSSAARKL